MENQNRSGSYSHSSFVGAHDVLMVQLVSSLAYLVAVYLCNKCIKFSV